jgi:hypothetical protein
MLLVVSMGYDNPAFKFFMRSTVTSSDLLIFFPAVIFFVQLYYKKLNIFKQVSCCCCWLYGFVCSKSCFLKCFKNRSIKPIVVNNINDFVTTFINSC